jgi:hypothetical protein
VEKSEGVTLDPVQRMHERDRFCKYEPSEALDSFATLPPKPTTAGELFKDGDRDKKRSSNMVATGGFTVSAAGIGVLGWHHFEDWVRPVLEILQTWDAAGVALCATGALIMGGAQAQKGGGAKKGKGGKPKRKFIFRVLNDSDRLEKDLEELTALTTDPTLVGKLPPHCQVPCTRTAATTHCHYHNHATH